MKIAVCSNGQDINDKLSPSFAKTPYFIIIDSETQKVKVTDNTCRHGKQCYCERHSARTIRASGAQVLISAQTDYAVAARLKRAGVIVVQIDGGISVKEALDIYQAKALHIVS